MSDPELQAETDTSPEAGLEPELAENALVEEVSIDGMCGVY